MLIGEVSTVNDDRTDNTFLDPIGRFSEIEEDVDPIHLLVSDYEKCSGSGATPATDAIVMVERRNKKCLVRLAKCANQRGVNNVPPSSCRPCLRDSAYRTRHCPDL